MDKEWKKKGKKKRRRRPHSFGKGSSDTDSGNNLHDNTSDVQESVPMEVSGSSSAAVAEMSSTASTSRLQRDNDRTHSHTNHSHFRQQRKRHDGEAWTDAGKGRKHSGNRRNDYNRNTDNNMHRNRETDSLSSQQAEGHSAEETQRRCRSKNCSCSNGSCDGEVGGQRGHSTERAGGGDREYSRDCSDSVAGSSGGRKKRGRNRGGKGRKKHSYDSQWASNRGDGGRNSSYDLQCASTSGSSGGASSSSKSFEIPGFYFDPEKKQYFKIMSSNFVPKDDKHFVTSESIQKRETEVQRQKDLAAFASGSKDMSLPCAAMGRLPQRPHLSSLPSALSGGYQRGDFNRRVLERAWVLNSVRQLKHTGTQTVGSAIMDHQSAEHMVRMEASREHGHLLCLWSVLGSVVQRLKLIDVQSAKPHSRTLSLQFRPASEEGDISSFNKVTSMCWADFPEHPGKKFVLYSSTCLTGQSQNLVFIRCLEEEKPAGFETMSYNFGRQMVWACAWNCHKQQFGLGAEKACVVIDTKTRQMQQFITCESDAISLLFSKEHGGTSLYTGTRKGNILMYDLRRRSSYPVDPVFLKHPVSVCCLRLSPEETYLYSSDFHGRIKRWDLRMRKELLTYDGLYNQHSYLPFHIDETQSLLYAAGQDCYTKLWCLKTGKLLLTVPPPYRASTSFIPAVSFATDWGKVPGNAGLIMGAHDNFYLYSLQDYLH